MKPVRTDTTNCVLKSPTPDVQDLPVTRFDIDGCPVVESCFELSDEDIEMILKTRKIYFSIYGTTHPPIYIGVESIGG